MHHSTAHPYTNSKSSAARQSLGYDFALLGLNVSESRVEIIREAAKSTAARIQKVTRSDAAQADQMLADLASSTYRLLDPRRRLKSRERIQLSIVGESDFELQRGSRSPLLDALTIDASSRPAPVQSADLGHGMLRSNSEMRSPCRIGAITLSGLLVLVAACGTACLLLTS